MLLNKAAVPLEDTGAVTAAVIVADDVVDEATVVTTCGEAMDVCCALLETGVVLLADAVDVGTDSLTISALDGLAFVGRPLTEPTVEVLVETDASVVVVVVTLMVVVLGASVQSA